MARDHYQVLEVKPTASFEEIKQAFRRKVMQCHPDRGGSHSEMILVIEAWGVLSDPELRRQYDSARLRDAQEEAEAVGKESREHAAGYPRRWADFEAWLNQVTNDIGAAQHGSTPLNDVWRLPTVSNSYSGCASIGIGVIVGILLGATVLFGFVPSKLLPGPKQREKIQLLCGSVGAFLGAWAGAWLHRGLQSSIKNSTERNSCHSEHREQPDSTEAQNADPAPNQHHIVACDRCGQKLRVPNMKAELAVTCRACGHKFTWRPPEVL